jgi:ADP-L-glycero-D-manno-heptose 6-epimerase
MAERTTYIVTGGAGFIGSNLVAALLTRQPRPHIIILDNLRSGSFANVAEACQRRGVAPFDGELWPDDAGNAWHWVHRFKHRLAGVFHLAAITDTTVTDEALMIRENVAHFDSMIQGCAEQKVPLVYASSAATYGSPPQARDRVPFPETAAGFPNNVYGFSKWLMENEHRRFAAVQRDTAGPAAWIVGLRYFNVFGPGEARKGKMASMVYQLASQMLGGERPRLFTDGSQARDQVYVDDVVECTMAAAGLGARKDPVPGIYNLGSGVATSFSRIVAALRRALGVSERDLPTEFFEMPLSVREFYQDYTCADLSTTERGLGWKPRWKPEQAIEDFGRWLKHQRR